MDQNEYEKLHIGIYFYWVDRNNYGMRYRCGEMYTFESINNIREKSINGKRYTCRESYKGGETYT
jgi:hypothetical protein